jgi:type VI secretion system protein ImpG
MFARYFEAELAYLRERAPELASGPYREVMRELLARDGDPDVERLVESFAFLVARLRERLEDRAPELLDALAETFAPHLLRGVPAVSVIEVEPRIEALRGVKRVAAGRIVEAPRSRAPDQRGDATPCTFRTATDLDIVPISAIDVHASRADEGHALTLSLRLTEAGAAALREERALRLFVHGEPLLARWLRHALLDRCRSIRARLFDRGGEVVDERLLAPTSLRQVGLDADEARVPWPPLAPAGLRVLVEAFAAPELLQFIDLEGPILGEARGERLDLVFAIDGADPPPGEVRAGALRLHCVPVVNLYPATSEPIRLDIGAVAHPLRIAGRRPDEVEIAAVVRVRSSRGGRAELRPFHPSAGLGRPPPGAATFHLLRDVSPIDGCVDASIAFSPADGGSLADLDGEVVHVDLLCTDRLAAADLGPGAICRDQRSGGLRFRNITAITPPARVARGPALRWRLLTHLALGQASLADAAPLRAYLSAYDVHHGSARSVAGQIDAIRSVTAKAAARVLQGALVRGVETRVDVDEAAFLGPGDAHLFGTALDQLLADRLGLNTFHELSLRLLPSERELRWPARCGGRALL